MEFHGMISFGLFAGKAVLELWGNKSHLSSISRKKIDTTSWLYRIVMLSQTGLLGADNHEQSERLTRYFARILFPGGYSRGIWDQVMIDSLFWWLIDNFSIKQIYNDDQIKPTCNCLNICNIRQLNFVRCVYRKYSLEKCGLVLCLFPFDLYLFLPGSDAVHHHNVSQVIPIACNRFWATFIFVL